MVIELMMVKMVVIVAPLRKGLAVALCVLLGKGFGCGSVPHTVCHTVCATSSSLALTSNQPHRFTPNALDYTDGADLGHPHLTMMMILRDIKEVQEDEGDEDYMV